MSNDIYQIFLETSNPREFTSGFLDSEYKYKIFFRNLRRTWTNQINYDIKRKIYDIPMLDRIIDSGQLDSHGCLTERGMRKFRFCKEDHGLEILN